MKAKRVSLSTDALLDPQAGIWSSAEVARIELIGTPSVMQPTEAVRNTWEGKSTGTVEQLSVAAVHNGQVLALCLEWQDSTENRQLLDNTSFSDAAAIAFPLGDDASIAMGSPDQPVNLWYWRADENGRGRHLSAKGIGFGFASETLDTENVRGNGLWHEGTWRVVMARALALGAQRHAVRLTPGGGTKVGFAVWDGDHRERGGIKAFSAGWADLLLER